MPARMSVSRQSRHGRQKPVGLPFVTGDWTNTPCTGCSATDNPPASLPWSLPRRVEIGLHRDSPVTHVERTATVGSIFGHDPCNALGIQGSAPRHDGVYGRPVNSIRGVGDLAHLRQMRHHSTGLITVSRPARPTVRIVRRLQPNRAPPGDVIPADDVAALHDRSPAESRASGLPQRADGTRAPSVKRRIMALQREWRFFVFVPIRNSDLVSQPFQPMRRISARDCSASYDLDSPHRIPVKCASPNARGVGGILEPGPVRGCWEAKTLSSCMRAVAGCGGYLASSHEHQPVEQAHSLTASIGHFRAHMLCDSRRNTPPQFPVSSRRPR